MSQKGNLSNEGKKTHDGNTDKTMKVPLLLFKLANELALIERGVFRFLLIMIPIVNVA